jgi:hypothetical protein
VCCAIARLVASDSAAAIRYVKGSVTFASASYSGMCSNTDAQRLPGTTVGNPCWPLRLSGRRAHRWFASRCQAALAVFWPPGNAQGCRLMRNSEYCLGRSTTEWAGSGCARHSLRIRRPREPTGRRLLAFYELFQPSWKKFSSTCFKTKDSSTMTPQSCSIISAASSGPSMRTSRALTRSA